MKSIVLIILGIYINTTVAQTPLGTEFTYQGELNNVNGNPHNGEFDFRFIAYDAQNDGSGGNLGTSLAADVTVSQGIFTTQIDFGDSAFMGDKVWLEISVRTGASTGSYTQLLPRQQITVAPYATHAQFVGADAISGIEIQDGTVTSAELSSNSVTTIKIANDSITTDKVVDNSITFDKIANNSITTDKVVNNSITFDKIANNSVNSEKVVDGSLKAIDIDNTQMQQRVGGSCVDGQYLHGINQDGSVQCKRLPIGLDFIVDSSGDVGGYASIVIGADNNPIISYFDTTNRDLKVYKCSNTSCSSGTARTLDSTGSVGEYTSIVIGTDNNPIISYYDATNDQLKVYKCSNPSCFSGTAENLDSSGDVGRYTSIAIGADNNPIISYTDFTNFALKVYKCHNTSCSSGGTVLTLDSSGSVGFFTSIAIGTDNNPIISYYDNTNGDLKLFKCSTPLCSVGTVRTLDSSGDVGQYTSIAIGVDNNPIISYLGGGLKVYKCSNTSCSAGTARTLDNTGNVGRRTSIAIGTDNNPIISYFDNENDGLKVYKCSNASCSTGTARFLVNTEVSSFLSQATSIAIGADNNPIISYIDFTNRELKVYSCVDESCRK